MTIVEIIEGVIGAILIVGLFGGLLYFTLFRAEMSNYPIATRGLGICMLASALKVLFLFGEALSPAFGADWLNYALIAVFVIGMLMMMSGFGGAD